MQNCRVAIIQIPLLVQKRLVVLQHPLEAMRNTNSAIILRHIDSASFNGSTDLFHALTGIEDGLIDARGKAGVE
jgi:hypothetical protein